MKYTAIKSGISKSLWRGPFVKSNQNILLLFSILVKLYHTKAD